MRTLKIEPAFGQPGKWQVRYYDPTMQLWFDHGDPCSSMSEADEKRRRIEFEDKYGVAPEVVW